MSETKPILLYIKITEPQGDDIERATKILKLWKENFEVMEVTDEEIQKYKRQLAAKIEDARPGVKWSVILEQTDAIIEAAKRELPQRYEDCTEEQKAKLFRMAVPYPEEWKKHETKTS